MEEDMLKRLGKKYKSSVRRHIKSLLESTIDTIEIRVLTNYANSINRHRQELLSK